MACPYYPWTGLLGSHAVLFQLAYGMVKTLVLLTRYCISSYSVQPLLNNRRKLNILCSSTLYDLRISHSSLLRNAYVVQ